MRVKKCQREISKMKGIKNILSVLTGNLAYSHQNIKVYFSILQQ